MALLLHWPIGHRLMMSFGLAALGMMTGAPSTSATARSQPEAPPAPAAEGIQWLDDLDAAMALAAKDARPVIAYFTFDTCVWCKRLERDTYSDPSVIQLSRKFIWVKVNRDVTPEIPKQFNVSAYPSLITLGDDKEKVYRFSGYKLPDKFIPELNEALDRYALYRAGKPWDTPAARPEQICDVAATVESSPAPTEDVPAGITFVDGAMWVAQTGSLAKLDWSTGRVEKTFPLDRSIMDICTDGRFIYAVTSGWTAGHPIHVIDPETGQTVRSIVTEANKTNRAYGAKGIELIDGKLYVLEGMRGVVRVVDSATGAIERSIQTSETWITSLAFDGTNLVVGSREALIFIDPHSGSTVKRIAVNYPLRSVGTDGRGSYYLMEQPVFGFDTEHKRIRVWPTTMQIYRLSLNDSQDMQR